MGREGGGIVASGAEGCVARRVGDMLRLFWRAVVGEGELGSECDDSRCRARERGVSCTLLPTSLLFA